MDHAPLSMCVKQKHEFATEFKELLENNNLTYREIKTKLERLKTKYPTWNKRRGCGQSSLKKIVLTLENIMESFIPDEDFRDGIKPRH